MKSLGVEEWLVEIVESMCRNAQSRVRVNGAFSDDFLIHAGLHQSSMLSCLFFVVVLETLYHLEKIGQHSMKNCFTLMALYERNT